MAPDTYSKGGQLLERLAASGADVVSIDHTIDLGEAKRRLAASDEVTCWGVGWEGDSTFTFGTLID